MVRSFHLDAHDGALVDLATCFGEAHTPEINLRDRLNAGVALVLCLAVPPFFVLLTGNDGLTTFDMVEKLLSYGGLMVYVARM